MPATKIGLRLRLLRRWNCNSTDDGARGILSLRKMPSPAKTELRVAGMTCNNCARKVTDAAQKVPGVHSVSVNVQTAHASVRWNTGRGQKRRRH